MKKKILGIVVCTLLIAATVLPVAGTMNVGKTTNVENNILGDAGLVPESSQEYGLQDNDWLPQGASNTAPIYHMGDVGIGTTSPSAKLDVEVSSGGAATIGHSSNTATGNYSIAMGHSTTASGIASTGMGWATTASGIASTVMGHSTTASGDASTAMGLDTVASGAVSTAMGYATRASGNASTAMGAGTTASGDHGSIAMGNTIIVEGDYSVGIGLDNTLYTVSADNVMSIMGGKVGIGTTSPNYLLHVLGGSGIVAQFSGRVKGADAVNDDEFVTKGQVKSISTSLYTPTGTSDTNGNVGDTAWDSNYFYVKTPDGWKRASLETW